MRRLKATGLLLALGILAARSMAEEIQWRPATPNTTSGSSKGPATLVTEPDHAERSQPSPVILSKPVPLANVTPVDYRGAVPLVRSAMPMDDVRDVRILPLGPPLNGNGVNVGGDKQKEEVIPIQPKEVNPSTPMMGGGSTSWLGGPILGDDCCCGCSDDCCGCFDNGCCCCAPRGNLWFSAEYLLWGVSQQHMPVLLETFPTGTSQTTVMTSNLLATPLVDQNSLPSNTRNGGRFTLGFWIPGCDDLGLEASYFFLGTRNSTAFFASSGNPILAIPLINAQNGQPVNAITAHPGPIGDGNPLGTVAGSFGLTSQSYLWGVEMNLRQKLCCGPCFYVDLLYGYRHIQLQDFIGIADVETALGSTTTTLESFGTRNQFNGGQVGIDAQWHFRPRWFIGTQFKLALGNVTQTDEINGAAFTSIPGMGVMTTPPRLHAQQGLNIGTFSQNRFAVAPEVGLKLGFDITENLKFWVGYDCLFLSNVIRAGDQIDNTISPIVAGVPQGNRPTVLFKTTSFTGQGVNFGLMYTF
jgi:hypothetical protein